MEDDAIYGRVPLWHEDPKVVQVPVAWIYSGKICKPVQARQILHSSFLLPELPGRRAGRTSRKGSHFCEAYMTQVLAVYVYLIVASLSGLIARLNRWDLVVVFTVTFVLACCSCQCTPAS